MPPLMSPPTGSGCAARGPPGPSRFGREDQGAEARREALDLRLDAVGHVLRRAERNVAVGPGRVRPAGRSRVVEEGRLRRAGRTGAPRGGPRAARARTRRSPRTCRRGARSRRALQSAAVQGIGPSSAQSSLKTPGPCRYRRSDGRSGPEGDRRRCGAALAGRRRRGRRRREAARRPGSRCESHRRAPRADRPARRRARCEPARGKPQPKTWAVAIRNRPTPPLGRVSQREHRVRRVAGEERAGCALTGSASRARAALESPARAKEKSTACKRRCGRGRNGPRTTGSYVAPARHDAVDEAQVGAAIFPEPFGRGEERTLGGHGSSVVERMRGRGVGLRPSRPGARGRGRTATRARAGGSPSTRRA